MGEFQRPVSFENYSAIEQRRYRNVHRLKDLWHSRWCQESEKSAGLDQSSCSYDAQRESLLPMESAEK